MHARSTSIAGDPIQIDACIRYVRDDVMPEVTAMDGCLGLSLLANRDTGRVIATTSWSSEDAMQATDGVVSPMRDRACEIMGGEATVDEWEIAVMHREHDAREGSWCRVTWLRCEPADVESTIDFFKDFVMASMEGMEGFCSASLMVDRATGQCCGTSRFETRADLEATRDMARGLRERRSRLRGVEFTDIDECEVAIAHLRVPELV
ncbi:antibiotic biosynthesis monooxygenase [Nocardioides sp.]|uniref:antibiotic biosynthesis monooxygenase n=1 Tax=Nocardioides sp. TaxID=35761 RepID=UPI00286D6DC9|nr:antibiotic biosynthesis monooxygenase [Nocardioides sp.]